MNRRQPRRRAGSPQESRTGALAGAPRRSPIAAPAGGRRATNADGAIRNHGLWRLTGLTLLMLGLAVVGAGWSATQSAQARAHAAIERHQFRTAERQLERLEWFGIRQGTTAILRSRIARLRGESADAESWLETARAAGVDTARLQRERLLLQTQRRIDGANVDQLTEALANDPDDAAAVFEACVLGAASIGDFDSAFSVLDRWSIALPDSAVPYYHRGELWLVAEQLDQAEIAFQSALNLDPEFSEARFGLLQSLVAQQRQLEALEQAREFLARDPTHHANVDVHRIKLELLAGADQSEEFLEDVRAVLAAVSDDYLARVALATAQARSGHPTDAVETLEPIESMFPDDVTINYLLAAAHDELGNSAAANGFRNRFVSSRHALDRLIKQERELGDQPAGPGQAKELALGFLRYEWQQAEPWIMQANLLAPADPQVLTAVATLMRIRGDEAAAAEYEEFAQRLASPRASG